MAVASPARWFCCRSADFALRDWPDGCVLFDEAQGQLQCLTVESGALMRLFLQRAQWTSAELAQGLFGESPTDDDVQMVENVALHFQSLNLIERLPV